MSENVTKVKLLIVDDEKDFLESSARALERRGFEVHTAGDGPKALEMIAQSDFEIVVLDLKMPGMDGEEVFDRIHKARPSTPVIMLTGHGSIPHAFKTSKKGIADYIAKPCDINELAERLCSALKLTKGRHRAPKHNVMPDLASMVEVLLVDDDVDFLSSLKNLLQRRNMNVSTAEGAAQAHDHLRSTLIEVAIIDVKLPGTSGLELLRSIRQNYPSVRVILLSGHPSASAAMEGIRCGASEYFTKPPEMEELVTTIRHLRRQREEDLIEQRQKLIEEIRARYPD